MSDKYDFFLYIDMMVLYWENAAILHDYTKHWCGIVYIWGTA
jgi:hypothetical protein